MKKMTLVVLILAGVMLAGCSDEFLAHDTLYKNWDHWSFSWWEYQDPTAEHAKLSNQQNWWGEAIPYIPAQ